MRCPSCQSSRLVSAYLEKGLPCRQCKKCGGNWLCLDNYLFWKERHGNELKQSSDSIKIVLNDSEHAMMCPKTGAFMVKYRIVRETNQHIDFSPQANSVWLDEGEWQLLIKYRLVDRLIEILTEPWQREIHLDETLEFAERMDHQLFDEATYHALTEIHQWIHQHTDKSAILAFLNSPDPFSENQSQADNIPIEKWLSAS